MTPAEKAITLVTLLGIAAAFVLPPPVVETGIAVQVAVLAVIAVISGAYIWRRTRGVTRRMSEYLWRLVRRDLRVTAGLILLGIIALLALLPRVLGIDPILSRPWGTVALVVAINMLAAGLIDDAIQFHQDSELPT